MKSLEELNKIREKTKRELNVRDPQNHWHVVVGMGTCGIAAGARDVMSAFLKELGEREVYDCSVLMTGCAGTCDLEPIVEVTDKDGKKVTYVKMTPEKAVKVVDSHIAGGAVVTEYTIEAFQK